MGSADGVAEGVVLGCDEIVGADVGETDGAELGFEETVGLVDGAAVG